MTQLLKQKQYSPLPFEEQVVAIYAGVKGYLDDIDASDVGEFETELLHQVRDKNENLLETIRKEEKLSDKSEEELKAVLEKLTKVFTKSK